jgi:hypothetical protein
MGYKLHFGIIGVPTHLWLFVNMQEILGSSCGILAMVPMKSLCGRKISKNLFSLRQQGKGNFGETAKDLGFRGRENE